MDTEINAKPNRVSHVYAISRIVLPMRIVAFLKSLVGCRIQDIAAVDMNPRRIGRSAVDRAVYFGNGRRKGKSKGHFAEVIFCDWVTV